MKLLCPSPSDRRVALPMQNAIPAMKDAFTALSTGQAWALPRGVLHVKPADGVVETTKVDDGPAVIPEVTGLASIPGWHEFLIDPEDPLKEGVLLR
ncbi:MAG: proline racemase family protein [Phycisphaerales bacterium]|nr:MAG: proline racemase family protein [Phycisphaerales bacterium]